MCLAQLRVLYNLQVITILLIITLKMSFCPSDDEGVTDFCCSQNLKKSLENAIQQQIDERLSASPARSSLDEAMRGELFPGSIFSDNLKYKRFSSVLNSDQ